MLVVTFMADEIPVFPAASTARTVSVWGPLAVVRVFQAKEWGGAETLPSSVAPS